MKIRNKYIVFKSLLKDYLCFDNCYIQVTCNEIILNLGKKKEKLS